MRIRSFEGASPHGHRRILFQGGGIDADCFVLIRKLVVARFRRTQPKTAFSSSPNRPVREVVTRSGVQLIQPNFRTHRRRNSQQPASGPPTGCRSRRKIPSAPAGESRNRRTVPDGQAVKFRPFSIARLAKKIEACADEEVYIVRVYLWLVSNLRWLHRDTTTVSGLSISILRHRWRLGALVCRVSGLR